MVSAASELAWEQGGCCETGCRWSYRRRRARAQTWRCWCTVPGSTGNTLVLGWQPTGPVCWRKFLGVTRGKFRVGDQTIGAVHIEASPLQEFSFSFWLDGDFSSKNGVYHVGGTDVLVPRVPILVIVFVFLTVSVLFPVFSWRRLSKRPAVCRCFWGHGILPSCGWTWDGVGTVLSASCCSLPSSRVFRWGAWLCLPRDHRREVVCLWNRHDYHDAYPTLLGGRGYRHGGDSGCYIYICSSYYEYDFDLFDYIRIDFIPFAYVLNYIVLSLLWLYA